MKIIHLFLWLVFVNFSSINLSFYTAGVSGHCLDHQESLLLHLKKNLIFSSSRSKKLVLWNQSKECCQWNGVTCNKGRVISLDLSEEFISGGLDNLSSLFNLQYLQSLNLAYNDFNSGIPSGIHKLKNLRSLNLSNAGFAGQVPKEISQLTRLVTLDLSTSHTNLSIPNITFLLQNLTKIIELYLDGVTVFAKGNEWGHAFSSLKDLKVLSMSSCGLSGPIDQSLVKLQSLSIIRLNKNNISSPVPRFFANFSYLNILQLSSCDLNGMFPKSVFKLQALEVLDLSNNQLLQGRFPTFPNHGSLRTLNLSSTNFSGSIPDSIRNLRQLSTLDISNCHFNGTLPSSISELTQLVHLDLSVNGISGPFPSFNMSKNLTYLSLFQNGLSGPIPFSHLEGLTNLVTIDLGENSFSGSVPSSLWRLSSLQRLMLPFNKFDGLLEEFANASLSLLEIIDLSGNNLEGSIPKSFFDLKKLRILQLPKNKFSGGIKLDIIQRLGNLETLDLSYNDLLVDATISDDSDFSSFPNMRDLMLASCKLRAFPSFLRNQSQLLSLDLSSNGIHGKIPNWILRLESLTSLNLSNNFLTNLEGPLWNLSSNLFLIDLHSNQLQGSAPIFTQYGFYLDYSNNKFSSITPADIGNHLPLAFWLSLSNNSLQGKIHESLCNILALRGLDLSYNSYNGAIPECLLDHHNLKVLNLRGNNLSGQISDTFSTSCALRKLDLNENLLVGAIPRSLANCSQLQLLNLGNNMLVDGFPCFLKKISTLQVLILRSNNLHGSIQCPKLQIPGNWERLQIVDLASNHFGGELPGALLRTWKAMMLGELKVEPKFGNIFFGMYDTFDPMQFIKALSDINKAVAMKFVGAMALEPRSLVKNFFSTVSYENLFVHHDSITVVSKGQQLKLVKVLTAFIYVDFSSNQFEGPIPEELMNLKALLALDLSRNAFSGQIPTSLRNLRYLESLDLSNNSLSGEIPTEIVSLSFLAFLNLSFNHLVGRIPLGTQIQSFEASSFQGNKGLYGAPLTQNCCGDEVHGPPPTKSDVPRSENESFVDWNILSAELGFIFGLGIVFSPLVFWRRWRLWYFKHIDNILYKIFPQLDFVYEIRGGQRYKMLRWRSY